MIPTAGELQALRLEPREWTGVRTAHCDADGRPFLLPDRSDIAKSLRVGVITAELERRPEEPA